MVMRTSRDGWQRAVRGTINFHKSCCMRASAVRYFMLISQIASFDGFLILESNQFSYGKRRDESHPDVYIMLVHHEPRLPSLANSNFPPLTIFLRISTSGYSPPATDSHFYFHRSFLPWFFLPGPFYLPSYFLEHPLHDHCTIIPALSSPPYLQTRSDPLVYFSFADCRSLVRPLKILVLSDNSFFPLFSVFSS